MAAPAVAGTIALMLDKAGQEHITLDPIDIANILFQNTCTTSCSISQGTDMGHGMLDAEAAVNAVGTIPLSGTHVVMSTDSSDITAGTPVQITAVVSDLGTTPVTPTGQVAFYNGPISDFTRFSGLTCSDTHDHTRTCTVQYRQTSSDPATVIAMYYGDDLHDMSSNQRHLKVQTEINIVVTPNSSPVPTTSTVSITGTVSTSSGPVSSGTITFDDGVGGGGHFNPTNGKCDLSHPPCTVMYTTSASNGNVRITANYSDDPSSGRYSDSNNGITLSVGPEFPAAITVIITIVFLAVVLLTRFGRPFINIHN